MTADEGRAHRFGGAIAVIVAVAALFGVATILFTLSQSYIPGHFESSYKGLDYVAAPGVTWRDAVLSAPSGCAQNRYVLQSHDQDLDGELSGPDPKVHARLGLVRCLLAQPDARLSATDAKGRLWNVPEHLRPRHVSDLGFRFWPPWIIGMVTLLMSGAVWALRPAEAATRLFAINGFALMISSMTIAAFTAHLPTSDPKPFWVLLVTDDISNQVFYLSLIALFMQYPRPLVPAPWAWGVIGLAAPYGVAVVLGWLSDTLATVLIPAVELVALIGLIGWQFVATRRLPRDRAALMWLGLSVLVGASLWLCLLASIMITGRTGDLGSIVALVLVFPFYVGLAMGVARFCLVELQDWAFRILFFVVAAVLFAAFDVALVTLLHLGAAPAASAAVLVVAFAYLPLRDIVWRRLFQGKSMAQSDMFAAVMDIVFSVTPSERATKWQSLLQGLFEPMRLEPAIAAPAEPMIAEGGLRMDVPAAAEAPALSLFLARQGRGLFSPSQLALVRQLIRLVRTASMSRDAYERGASETRRRLAQDLHDDVGARLMTGLSVADAKTKPILHGALSEIRAIAAGMTGQTAPLDTVLADIRHECVRRFEAAGLETEWPVWPADAPLILLDYGRQKALASTLRETASNIIRHAEAKHVSVAVTLDGDRLCVRIADDGKGFSDGALSGEQAGHGLKNLQSRLAEAGGTARFGNNETPPGAWVDLTLSLGSGGTP